MFGRKLFIVAIILGISFLQPLQAETITELEVDTVWAGHRVGLALLTHSPKQYVGYYNAERHMVIASRNLDESTWDYKILPEKIEWDSHNYITMAMDSTNRLHISGNLHVDPLVYFKMEKPHDLDSIQRVHSLIGTEEKRMTYPRFFRGPAQEFIFTYRDGRSGSGNQIYNLYNESSGTWERLLDKPLTDGEGKMNAYIDGPRLGPDGYYHCVWVWRDTYDCATNHHVSYMRSRDLRTWENAAGDTLALPISIQSPGTVVDPVPPGGGAINGNVKLGFDGQKQPVVSYHKYDVHGNTQIYNARWTTEGWKSVQATNWNSRWEFSGGGSIDFNVRVKAIRVDAKGIMTQGWSHWELGNQHWKLDPETLAPIHRIKKSTKPKSAVAVQVQSDFPGMQVRTAHDLGRKIFDKTHYHLRWETLGPNRDRPREKPWPDASPLILVEKSP